LGAILAVALPCCMRFVGAAAESPAASTSENWTHHGRDTLEQRFSPLTTINDGNVGRLGLAWFLELPGEHTLEATPLEVNGVIYFSGGLGSVYAVDAALGRLLWKYEPQTNSRNPRDARILFGANRGVAYWDGKVYVALKDGWMVALDAATGRVVWSTRFLRPGDKSVSSGAPRVFKGKVIIGNSGAEFGARGYVTTLDARSGKVLWRFFIVPGDPAKGPDHAASDSVMPMAAKTWSGDWWNYGGGGTPWNAMTFDEELNQLYIGTGNGGPWNPRFRSDGSKDNLFLTSVIALDPDTGRYKWHYQFNPLDAWDYKATADMILADLTIDGVPRKVLMEAPTNGFFYVIDRQTGKLISAEKIGKVTWADRIDLKSGRPVERPGIRYEKAPFTMFPGVWGAHNWQASSYNPNTGLVYIPYMQIGTTFIPASEAEADVRSDPARVRPRLGVTPAFYTDPTDPMDGKGSLLAWDPVAQKLRWRVNYPSVWNAGTMTTAGNLVFQGTNQGQFYAYNASTGERLWAFDAKLGIVAPPITYSVGQTQYVSLLVGYGGVTESGWAGSSDRGWKYGLQPRRLLTFALGGRAGLPYTAPPDTSVHAVDDAAITLDPGRVQRGQSLFMNCMICHGAGLVATSNAPDLRESRIAMNRDSLKALLRSGALLREGMPKYDDLTDDEIDDLYQYIRAGARQALEGTAAPSGKPGL
jgi:quinohemoprotein ethanol dehydrogenase